MDSITARVQSNRTEQLQGFLTPNNQGIKASLGYYVVNAQTQRKTATSSLVRQEVVPDAGYTLSRVTIQPLPVTRELNAKGGYTIKIGV